MKSNIIKIDGSLKSYLNWVDEGIKVFRKIEEDDGKNMQCEHEVDIWQECKVNRQIFPDC